MYRRRIEKRVQFTNEQKIEMLQKSKFRCCHCGKKIDIGHDFSVEHVIPLSKGGSNEPSNMIALCNRCNYLKGNMVYNPKEYYKYLNHKHLEVLVNNMEAYLDRFAWFNRYNLFPYDVMYFDYIIEIKISGRMNKGGIGKYPVRKVVLKKAIDTEYYSDYDRIYNFILKYNEKYNIQAKGLKGMVTRAINDGCCYYLTYENSEEIIMVIPISISALGDSRTPTIYVRNIMAFKDSEKVAVLMAEIIDALMMEFCKIAKEFDCMVVPFFIEVNKEQENMLKIFSEYFNCYHTDRIIYFNNDNSDFDDQFMSMNCLAIDKEIRGLESLKDLDINKELEKYRMMADDKLAEPMGMRWSND